jgi:ferredoxin
MSSTDTELITFLNRQEQEDWTAALAELLPSIHEVDRAATQIWFKFYPLELFRALEEAPDRAILVQRLLIQGHYELVDQIDTSHTFLYGHRFWPDVREAVTQRLKTFTNSPEVSLVNEIKQVAEAVAVRLRVDVSLVTGITAVAFMTLLQVGTTEFAATRGKVHLDGKHARLSPEKILETRAKDDGQGVFGFLKTINKSWTVTYNENDGRAHFKLMNEEELASGAARDQSRKWTELDARCIEGPIPVECRSASCGTCWIGVLGGAEKLGDVARREGRRLKEFGYDDTSEPKPLIRLACQAQAYGAVSIVIPPWNGVFGKYLAQRAAGGPADPMPNEAPVVSDNATAS